MNHYLHKLVVPQRIDIIPSNNKERKIIEKVREFYKQKSVFKDWVEDTEEILEQCMEHDFKHWKLEKFVKNEED